MPVTNTTTAEYELYRSPLASRWAGHGAHRDIERGKLVPDPIGGIVFAGAVSHVRGWHARVSQQ